MYQTSLRVGAVFSVVFLSLLGMAQAQLTWSLRALPRDGKLGSVTFGTGKFVAATGAYDARGSFVATSSDGISWQLVPCPIEPNSIASSGSNFVIADWSGNLMSSANGTAWTPIVLPSTATGSYNPSELAFSAGRYFFTASIYLGAPTYATRQLLIFTSSTLTPWTVRTTNLTEFVDCVAYGASRFVASVREGAVYYIYTSTDGATWTRGASLGSNQPRKIRFLNGRFVAVGARGSIWISTDGLTWSKKSAPSVAKLVDVGFGKGLYVVLAEAGQILVSSDSNTWTLSPFGGYWSELRSVSFGGNKFLITGPKEAVLQSN